MIDKANPDRDADGELGGASDMMLGYNDGVIDPNDLYAKVRGKLKGRIGGPAYHKLAERIVEDGAGFALEAAGKRWPIVDAA